MFLSEFIKSLGLEEKGNWTTSIVISSTGPLCNCVTINCEGSSGEDELVYKTFDTVEGVVRANKHMATVGGFPTTAEDFVEKAMAGIAPPAKVKK